MADQVRILQGKKIVQDPAAGHHADVLNFLEDGDLQNLGMMNYDKRLVKCSLLAIRRRPPYVAYCAISKDGSIHDTVPITIPTESMMMYDIAITENCAILWIFYHVSGLRCGYFRYLNYDEIKKDH